VTSAGANASLDAPREETVQGTGLARLALAIFCAGVPLDVLSLGGTRGAQPGDSIAVALGLALVAAGGWQIIRRRQARRLGATMLFLTAFTAWASLSIFWASNLEAAENRMRTFAQLLAFVLLGWQIALSRRDGRYMAAGYVLGCSIAAWLTWRAFFAGNLFAEFESRYAAQGFDPNDLGVTLAIGIPVAGYLAFEGRGTASRLWLAYLPLAVGAVALSGSRGASLSAAIGAATTLGLATSRRPWTAAGAAALLAASGLAAWWVVPLETWDRIFTIGEQLSGGTIGGRAPIWRAGLDVFSRHPILGVGVGGFARSVSPALGEAIAAHNSLLSIGVEFGSIGLLLFLGALASVLVGAARSQSLDRALVLGLVVTWTVGAASLSWEYRKTTWFVLLLCAAVVELRRAEPSRESA
jgi:O-antigen ligase